MQGFAIITLITFTYTDHMKKITVAVTLLLLTACARDQAPANTLKSQASITPCHWYGPENPHQSTWAAERLGVIEIKASATGDCDPSTDPVEVTAGVTLEKAIDPFGLFWTTVGTGAPVTRNIQTTGAVWRRNELFATAPCVPGLYRSTLARTASVAGGIAGVLGPTYYSSAVKIECKNKRVSMVIDDTGSMGGVIGSVSAALSSYISSRPEDEPTEWNLTTFKDSPTTVGTTQDRATAQGWVNALYASGGGDCPEDALGGISSGLAQLSSGPDAADADKQMIVATDASAHDGDISGIIATAQASGVKVNVLLAGDCSYAPAGLTALEVSSQSALKRIALETGGQYFFIPGGSTADYEAALNTIFASIANPTPQDSEPPVVTLSVTPSVIWPPNHQMVEVKPTVSAKDNVDPSPIVELVGVTVSEPEDGQGSGNTANDVQVSADGRIYVRAERSGQGHGRVYTITYKATDASGNIGYASAKVNVPKSQGK